MPGKHPIFDHLQRDGKTVHAAPDAAPDSTPATDAQPTREASSAQPGPAASDAPSPDDGPAASDAASPDNPSTDASQQETPPPSRLGPAALRRLIRAARRRWRIDDAPGRLIATTDQLAATPAAPSPATDTPLFDALIATPGGPALPDEVFPRLRWGGQLLYLTDSEHTARRLAEAYDGQRGFILEQPVTPIRARRLGLPLPGLTQRGYAMLARKTRLVQPGQFTERFTYDVRLTPCRTTDDTPEGFLVTKRVPQYHELLQRLKQKFPNADAQDLAKRAHKLVDHVFPTFLTREAAMLAILQDKLAPAFRHRVPKPLGIEKDRRGFVRTLHMSWVRIGGEPISQLDFAIQAAELLQALHEQARIMHLDLRMDNMVITPDGVGFVDFGSACRLGEQVERSPMLGELYSEMMRTSQIQRMLGKMIERGHVTNNAIAEVYGKVDKTVDAFYLAVQIAKPHASPELRQLIDYRPDSDAAHMLSALTAAVLRPKNPEMAQYKTAADLVRGLRRIEQRLAKRKR